MALDFDIAQDEIDFDIHAIITVMGNTTREGIVAFAGGGQENATVLNANYNIVDQVASVDASCKLDAAIENKTREVFNSTDTDMVLFPSEGERFKNGADLMNVDESFPLAAGNSFKLVCYSNGIWRF